MLDCTKFVPFNCSVKALISTFKTNYYVLALCHVKATGYGVCRLLGAVIYANQSNTRLNSERVAIELGQLDFFAKPLKLYFRQYSAIHTNYS